MLFEISILLIYVFEKFFASKKSAVLILLAGTSKIPAANLKKGATSAPFSHQLLIIRRLQH
ncbi:hypothetical protein GCM10009001_00250 [Virgibacillus siamensis]|uniref:Uncharacterized protein n=1 Tax=Virgibacillus siamensis TaxID=480071 RepID=A0ABN1FD79_9BACI